MNIIGINDSATVIQIIDAHGYAADLHFTLRDSLREFCEGFHSTPPSSKLPATGAASGHKRGTMLRAIPSATESAGEAFDPQRLRFGRHIGSDLLAFEARDGFADPDHANKPRVAVADHFDQAVLHHLADHMIDLPGRAAQLHGHRARGGQHLSDVVGDDRQHGGAAGCPWAGFRSRCMGVGDGGGCSAWGGGHLLRPIQKERAADATVATRTAAKYRTNEAWK